MEKMDISSPTLSSLPAEVLLQIFSYFKFSIPRRPYLFSTKPIPEDDKALRNMCRVSKQFKALAQPLLFNAIIVGKIGIADGLLVTLTQFPHLGSMIKDLIYLVQSREYLEQLPEIPFTPTPQDSFDSVRSHLQLPDAILDGISQGLVSSDADAFHDATVAFWLALAPNLTLLRCTVPHRPRLVRALVENTLQSIADDQNPCLSSLGYLGAFPDWNASERRPFHVGTLDGFLKLPGLKSLFVQNAAWNKTKSDEDFLLQDCGLEELETAQLSIRPRALQNLLSTCSSLRVLKLSINDTPGFDPSRYDIGDMLRAYGGGLEFLKLRVDWHLRDDCKWSGAPLTEEQYLAHKIGNLQSLSRLKYLDLAIWFFDDVRENASHPTPLDLAENLPSSLEVFIASLPFLEANKDGLGQELCTLAEKKRLSGLRKVYVTTAPKLPRPIDRSGWTYWDTDEFKVYPMSKITE